MQSFCFPAKTRVGEILETNSPTNYPALPTLFGALPIAYSAAFWADVLLTINFIKNSHEQVQKTKQ
jgi:hypothetical protein